ncbi:MAG TPA: hypothetical protein VFA23_01415 [Dongiaceae bacterium]|nr:hypothetical protein [Dongiaceae bacterium]
MFKADGEPRLSELLADPILELLMRRDGISMDELRRLIAAARGRGARLAPPRDIVAASSNEDQ